MMNELLPVGHDGSVLTTRVSFPIFRSQPVSVRTGSGTAPISHPPTIQAPPNAVDAISQQLATSSQLYENTETGTGIGAGMTSAPRTVIVKTTKTYVILALLGAGLVLAYAWDRGAL